MFAFIGIGVFFALGKSWKEKGIEVIVTIVALLVVPVAIVIALRLTGEWHDAILSYLKTSASYVTSGESVGWGFFF